jgi:predicted metalloenzyme YecM
MDPAVWQDQIDLYAQLGQFTKRVPKLDEVMTLDILNATADSAGLKSDRLKKKSVPFWSAQASPIVKNRVHCAGRACRSAS